MPVWPLGKSRKQADRTQTAGLGAKGEKLARQFLKTQGLKILAANYRCPSGEADLIALDPSTKAQAKAQTIVFVEVKTRTSDRYTSPEAAVDGSKRQSMKKVADYYLSRHDPEATYNVRFDIIAIVSDEQGQSSIKHIADAF